MSIKPKTILSKNKKEEMMIKIKSYIPMRRIKDLYWLFKDFVKKCNDDHITAFGAMSAFFILLSLLPFMIILLTTAQYLPFSKEDILTIMSDFISFENKQVISGILNELYHKISPSVFTVSIIAALWSSSKGIFSIVKGFNSIFDIDDTRNYLVLRIFSVFYTILFAIILIAMLILWVFGNTLFEFVQKQFPFLQTIVSLFLHRGTILTFLTLVVIFMWMYHFIPAKESRFFHQAPGAIIAALGWIVVSELCALYMDSFSNFTYVYGSLAGIMILLIWLYLCMSMVFYGAEFNYFLENQKNYHTLVRIMRPNFREARRLKEKELKEELKKQQREKHQAKQKTQ